MQTQNPFLDEFAKLTTAAMGIAQAAGDEAKTAMRAHADKWAAELDLVRREDFDALKAELAALRAEVAALKAESGVTVSTPKAAKPASAPKTGGATKAAKKSE
jgi:BMFP domain-containing protein YqiC